MLKIFRKHVNEIMSTISWQEHKQEAYVEDSTFEIAFFGKDAQKKEYVFSAKHHHYVENLVLEYANELQNLKIYIGYNNDIVALYLYQLSMVTILQENFEIYDFIQEFTFYPITTSIIPALTNQNTFKMNAIYNPRLYKNALEIIINNNNPSIYAYVYSGDKEKKIQKVLLVDRNYNINSIVYTNIERDYINQMIEQCKRVELINKKGLINPYRIVNMQNNQFLIKQIESLKNINIWELLAYGSFAYFVPDELIIDYATDLVKQNKDNDNPIILQFAEILKPDEEQITQVFEKHFGDKEMFLQGKGNFYNEIWRYLDATIKMHEKKVL